MKLAAILTLGFSVAAIPSAKALILEFAVVDGANIVFRGDTDAFEIVPLPPSPAHQFILDSSDGSGDARDTFGRIDGLFQIGAVTRDGVRQSAPVLGTGTLRLRDGRGYDLTGTFAWNTITTSDNFSGFLNEANDVNLTHLEYAGSLADFSALANAGAARMKLAFGFIPPRSVLDLTADGAVNGTAYAGWIEAVPEPSATALLVVGLVGITALVGRRKPSAPHRVRWRQFARRSYLLRR